MKVTYEIVHIRKDKTQEVIATVDSKDEIKKITDVPQYNGTWIRDDRKILRWSNGELRVNIVEQSASVEARRTTYIGSMPLYELLIANGDELKIVCLNNYIIVGYNAQMVPLWQTASFTQLSDIVGKDLAYEIHQLQELYVKERDKLDKGLA